MLRVAIAGAGLMGRWHAYYARRCKASVVGVADPNRPESELRKYFRGAAVFREPERLLAELKPDVLHVCTPAGTHERLIELALRAGVHLIVEKPLAPDADTTERLAAEAAERKLLLVPVHQYVFQDGAVRAVAMLPEIGTLLHFDAVICSAGGSRMAEAELDDLVTDILPHPLSLLDRISPGALESIDWTCFRSAPGEWTIHGVHGALSVSVLVSLHARPTESSLRLRGTNGAIHLDLFHGFAMRLAGRASRTGKILHPFSAGGGMLRAATLNLTRRVIFREPAYPGLRRLIALSYDAIRQHGKPPLSASHTIAVARVRDRMKEVAARCRSGPAGVR
jgi:predicted dehydrogenase